MTPKIIHYCWFGKKQKDKMVKKCIATWRKFFPDYKIIEWNEEKIDMNINLYVKEAYEKKKWAFVSDYVRLFALYKYGGIYLDTDVEVLKPFDALLLKSSFVGFESKGVITSWLIGATPKNEIIKEFMDCYEKKHFVVNGHMDLTPNTVSLSEICKRHGMIEENRIQDLGEMVIYPIDYFCGKSIVDGRIRITENTYTIHYFDGGWQSPTDRMFKKIKYSIFKIIGESAYPYIRKVYRKLKDR